MQKTTYLGIALWLLGVSLAFAQTVSGILTEHTNSLITLNGYNGNERIVLGSTTTDAKGKFSITSQNYNGIASLELNSETSLLLVLNKTHVALKGTHLNALDSLQVLNSPENTIFENFTVAHSQRENALAGWLYLYRKYNNPDNVLFTRKKTFKKIEAEIKALSTTDKKELSAINKDLYVSWYLPLRKLLADMPASVDHYYERIPEHIKTFRSIDFNDIRFKTSGLRDVLIEKHYWLLENSSGGRDAIIQKMNASTDYILQNVAEDETLFNDLSLYLLKMLEKRSQFASAEYLSLKLLSTNACTIDDKLSNRAENYRAMKKGNTTKNIVFTNGVYRNGKQDTTVKSLADLKNKQTLVVFGASWCPKCQEELLLIKKYYNHWTTKGIEVVFVSIDEDPKLFSDYTSIFPWLSA